MLMKDPPMGLCFVKKNKCVYLKTIEKEAPLLSLQKESRNPEANSLFSLFTWRKIAILLESFLFVGCPLAVVPDANSTDFSLICSA